MLVLDYIHGSCTPLLPYYIYSQPRHRPRGTFSDYICGLFSRPFPMMRLILLVPVTIFGLQIFIVYRLVGSLLTYVTSLSRR